MTRLLRWLIPARLDFAAPDSDGVIYWDQQTARLGYWLTCSVCGEVLTAKSKRDGRVETWHRDRPCRVFR